MAIFGKISLFWMSSFLWATLALSLKEDFALSEAKRTISRHLNQNYPRRNAGDLCSQSNCCNITATETCPMNKFAKDSSNLIFPGGETRCIFSYSTPYAFQVIPGDSDNLLFYFQGGGACWDEWSTKTGEFCATDVSPQSLVGVFDRTNLKNAYKSYTIVHVLYCSGDTHGGNVIRSYTDADGQPVVQKGLANTQSALNWVKDQMKIGALSQTFSNLVIMGCSAGSLGAQLWGSEILSQLSWKQAAIVPDSYAGVFPESSYGELIYSFGFCSSGFLSEDLYQKCMNQQLDIIDVDLEFMNNYPAVPYTFLQSKTDAVQISFYISVATSTNATQKAITPTQFYNKVNLLFGDYNTRRKNFVTYLVDGDQHCFTPMNLYYEADTKGPDDNGATTTTPMMSDWVNQLPLADRESISTRCDGNVKGGVDDNTYCSSKVVPKEFIEQYSSTD